MVFKLDESTISSVAGAVVSMASVVSYIITEGKVDAESAKNAVGEKANGPEHSEAAGLGRIRGTAAAARDESAGSALPTDGQALNRSSHGNYDLTCKFGKAIFSCSPYDCFFLTGIHTSYCAFCGSGFK